MERKPTNALKILVPEDPTDYNTDFDKIVTPDIIDYRQTYVMPRDEMVTPTGLGYLIPEDLHLREKEYVLIKPNRDYR